MIDIAIQSSFLKYINDKKSNNKSYETSDRALYKNEQEVLLENIDLNKEVLDFLQSAQSDRQKAEIYLEFGDTKKLYNLESIFVIPYPSEGSDIPWKLKITDHHYNKVERHIKAFRTELLERISKEGDPLIGYKIISSQNELLKILDNMHTYQYGSYDDQIVLHFARYFYKLLWDKGRDHIYQKLLKDSESGNENKTGAQKHDKKQNKKNKRKKNKNKNKVNSPSTQNQQQVLKKQGVDPPQCL